MTDTYTIPVGANNVTSRIRESMLARYPLKEVPSGAWSEMAEEFHVGRSWISQIGQGLHMKVVPVKRETIKCVCGQEYADQVSARYRKSHGKLSDKCKHSAPMLTIICGHCGKRFPRLKRVVRHLIDDERYRGMAFCSRECNYLARKGRKYVTKKGTV